MFLIQKKKKKKNGLSNICAPEKFPRQFSGIMRNAIGFNLSGIEMIIIVIYYYHYYYFSLHRQLLKYNRRCIWGYNVWVIIYFFFKKKVKLQFCKKNSGCFFFFFFFVCKCGCASPCANFVSISKLPGVWENVKRSDLSEHTHTHTHTHISPN